MSRAGDWLSATFGIPVIESPFVPPDRFYLVPADLGFAHPRLFELLEPIDWPPGRRWLDPEHPLADVVARERAIAFATLEAQLDGMCDDLGLDPEVVWRAPRRAEDRDRRLRANQIQFAMEGRLALNIVRPADLIRCITF